jgi:hypothetical protein
MYAIPTSMYASQIWATPFLRQGREMDNPLQMAFDMLRPISGSDKLCESS